MRGLRGHHLICLHFYGGEGYDRDYIDNLERTLEEIRREGVVVLEGPDDVCRPCPHRRGDQCTFSSTADREVREMDGKALQLLGLRPGGRVEWGDLRESVAAVFPRWFERHCALCSWRGACEKSPLFRQLKGRRRREAP